MALAWKDEVYRYTTSHTALKAWDFDTILTVTTAAERVRVKNLFLRGTFSLDQATESNAQRSTCYVSLLLFPDTVTTPDPDDISAGASIDRQLKGGRFVLASGQNNPTLFTFKYRAINVNPGQKLVFATQVVAESDGNVSNRIELMGTFWRSSS